MKIIDCFTFFNELELLELRLMELYDTVEHFVLVEANRTHTGKDKDFVFENNKHLFQKYLDKIVHVKVEDLPMYDKERAKFYPEAGGVDWYPENFQRNCIMRGLQKVASKGDKILVSDLDEIPKISSILENVENKSWVVFDQAFFYYHVNCQMGERWNGTIMADYGTFKAPQDLRNHSRISKPNVMNAGWHYSYMGGADRVKIKIENIAESAMFDGKVGDVSALQKQIESQEDVLGRKEDFAKKKIVDISGDMPRSLPAFLKKYPHFYFGDASNLAHFV